jgi:hypothetical protein
MNSDFPICFIIVVVVIIIIIIIIIVKILLKENQITNKLIAI